MNKLLKAKMISKQEFIEEISDLPVDPKYQTALINLYHSFAVDQVKDRVIRLKTEDAAYDPAWELCDNALNVLGVISDVLGNGYHYKINKKAIGSRYVLAIEWTHIESNIGCIYLIHGQK